MEFSSSPPPRGGSDANSMRSFNKEIQHHRFHDGLHGRFHNIFQDNQTPPSNSLKLIEFETYYIDPNPILFLPPTKYAMIPQHDPFSLHTMLEGL
jgi:hypothetical protein